ncbi:hypothetical protein CS542_01175 [Pedobacter sp. IW39]|nr:hypothetical protein CS542_01175 [Pedobacter sp. IW39]
MGFRITQSEFEITAAINGANQTIQVQPDETSDGVSILSVNRRSAATQIRKDEDSKWEQMWGTESGRC